MEGRKGTIRAALCENLRELTQKGLFEKITIKKICDETGVIRATFYNHFDDKYDCLNEIVYRDIVASVDMDRLVSFSAMELFTQIFQIIGTQKAFYRAAWAVTGQNSFEEMVKDNFKILLLEYFNRVRNPYVMANDSNELLAMYYASSLTFMAHLMIFDHRQFTAEQIIQMTEEIMTHALSDLVQAKK